MIVFVEEIVIPFFSTAGMDHNFSEIIDMLAKISQSSKDPSLFRQSAQNELQSNAVLNLFFRLCSQECPESAIDSVSIVFPRLVNRCREIMNLYISDSSGTPHPRDRETEIQLVVSGLYNMKLREARKVGKVGMSRDAHLFAVYEELCGMLGGCEVDGVVGCLKRIGEAFCD